MLIKIQCERISVPPARVFLRAKRPQQFSQLHSTPKYYFAVIQINTDNKISQTSLLKYLVSSSFPNINKMQLLLLINLIQEIVKHKQEINAGNVFPINAASRTSASLIGGIVNNIRSQHLNIIKSRHLKQHQEPQLNYTDVFSLQKRKIIQLNCIKCV